MNDIDYIGASELIFNKDSEEGIYTGGFSIKSTMMKAGMSPIITLNTQTGGNNSGKVSDLFESLVLPNWALSYGNRMTGGKYKDYDDIDNDEEIDDDLHDRLVDLARDHEHKITKEANQIKKKKTRKQTIVFKKNGTKKRKQK